MEKNFMTTWQLRSEENFVMYNLATFFFFYQQAGFNHFCWTMYCPFHSEPQDQCSTSTVFVKSQVFLFVFPPLCLLPSHGLCQTAASLNQLVFDWKWSVHSAVQGVSLTRLCTLSRIITTVCRAFMVVWTKWYCWCFLMINVVPLQGTWYSGFSKWHLA